MLRAMASAIESNPWRTTGMSSLDSAERERRERLALDYLNRLRAEVSAMKAPPRPETVAWAVDELNELAGCVDAPETPAARYELDLLLGQLVEKLREGAPAR
jgi:hypothetical protein